MRGSTGRSCVSLVLLKSGCVCVTNVTKNVYVKLKESNEKFIEKDVRKVDTYNKKSPRLRGLLLSVFDQKGISPLGAGAAA